ncbi:NAD-dependent epimerase/dehydratase family protein [Thermodesulfobacteriota bacterium]
MKILVTGGAGFIGSNVVDGYVKVGHDVLAVDNLSTGKESNVNPDARFFHLDIRSQEAFELVEKEKPDIINHHAAQISVPESVVDPLIDADINIKGFLNLLQASVKAGVKKIVFISSGGAIYGEASEYPTSENFMPKPLSPYAISKFTSEHYLFYYRAQYGLDYTTLRYANIFGPRQVPHGEAGVVAIFMDNLLAGRSSVLNHFKEDREGMVRDYTYVGDVVKANIKALEKGSGDFFNIGTGIGTKTLTLYRAIYDAFVKLIPGKGEGLSEPEARAARSGDLTRSCLVVEKAGKILGWTPETDLKEGIERTWKWRLDV